MAPAPGLGGGMTRKKGVNVSKPRGALRLVAIDASAPAREFYLDRKRLSVGSASGNDLVVADPTVSRKHALLGRRWGFYEITDLESTNGTFVNGRRIDAPTRVRPGDQLRFGAARFALAGAAAPRRPLLRRAKFVAGIGALCAIGFFATQYLMTWNRLENVAEAPGENPTPTPAPAPIHRAPLLAKATVEPRSRTTAAPAPVNRVPAVAPATVKSGPRTPSVAAASGAGARVGAAVKVAPPAPGSGWLARLNYWRTVAGLAPVTEDPALSDGDLKHALYLIKNYGQVFRAGGAIGAAAHTEDSSNRWFTPAGFAAARASDETYWAGPPSFADRYDAIDAWLTTPFHRLWILSPLLRRVGYGEKCEAGACVVLLNVIGGSDPIPKFGSPLKEPVRFPPPNATVPASMASFEDEWPSPLTACDGYSFPSGLAVTLELGPMVEAKLSDYSISRAGTVKIEACGIDAESYRNPDPSQTTRIVHVLRGQGAVAIIPKAPLHPGSRYDVSMTVNGDRYTWSFAVSR
jgi:uncharacterized protein YkwD